MAPRRASTHTCILALCCLAGTLPLGVSAARKRDSLSPLAGAASASASASGDGIAALEAAAPKAPTPEAPLAPGQAAYTIHVVGDSHGDYNYLARSLVSTGRFEILDTTGKIGWKASADKFEVVVLGDVIDRGTHSVKNLQTLKNLSESDGADGRLTVILGNHEDMYLIQSQQFGDPWDRAARADMVRASGSEEAELHNWVRDLPLVRISKGVLMMHAGMQNSSLDAFMEVFGGAGGMMPECGPGAPGPQPEKCTEQVEKALNALTKEYHAAVDRYLKRCGTMPRMDAYAGCIDPSGPDKKGGTCADAVKLSGDDNPLGEWSGKETMILRAAWARCEDDQHCLGFTVDMDPKTVAKDLGGKETYGMYFLQRTKPGADIDFSDRRTMGKYINNRDKNGRSATMSTFLRSVGVNRLDKCMEDWRAPKKPQWMDEMLWYRGYSDSSGAPGAGSEERCKEAADAGRRIGARAMVVAHTTHMVGTKYCHEKDVPVYAVDTHFGDCDRNNECDFDWMRRSNVKETDPMMPQSLQIEVEEGQGAANRLHVKSCIFLGTDEASVEVKCGAPKIFTGTSMWSRWNAKDFKAHSAADIVAWRATPSVASPPPNPWLA